MPVFQDSKEPVFYVPEGDYIFCVTKFEMKYSQGAKTSGAEQYELTCEVEDKNSHYYETLIAHPSTLWRLEAFLRCVGHPMKSGDGWSFSKDEAVAQGWKWINPLGLRGHVNLRVEEYPVGSGKRRNKVNVYYVSKGMLPARVIVAPEPPEDDRPPEVVEEF